MDFQEMTAIHFYINTAAVNPAAILFSQQKHYLTIPYQSHPSYPIESTEKTPGQSSPVIVQ